jgi:signal-transduction protein with cAMP-binding, CBS, and nucleotidyltransferase domain
LSYINEKEAETILIRTIMNHSPLLEATHVDSIFTVSNLMKEGKVSSIIILDQNTKPIGIITERDIVRRVISDGKDPKITKTTDIMSKPLITVEESTHLYDATKKMVKHKIRRLPIVKDNNTLVGIVTVTDIIKYYYEKNKDDNLLAKAMIRYGKYWDE